MTISSERIISKEAASPEFEGNHTLSGIRIPLEEKSGAHSKEAACPEFEGNHTLSGIRIPLEEHSQLLDQFFL